MDQSWREPLQLLNTLSLLNMQTVLFIYLLNLFDVFNYNNLMTITR